jgi:outer membrane protein assembly factor BamD
MQRGAYVAALNRAQYTIEHYDGAPAVRQALEIMIHAYRRMQLTDLADKSEAVYHENYPDRKVPADRDRKKSWWKIFG